MDFEQECDELIDAIATPLADGEKRWQRAVVVGMEAADVVLCAIDKLDDENKVADLAELGMVAAEKTAAAAERLLAARPLLVAAMVPTLRVAVPVAVAALGVYSPRITLLKQALVPGIKAGDKFFSRLAEKLGE